MDQWHAAVNHLVAVKILDGLGSKPPQVKHQIEKFSNGPSF